MGTSGIGFVLIDEGGGGVFDGFFDSDAGLTVRISTTCFQRGVRQITTCHPRFLPLTRTHCIGTVVTYLVPCLVRRRLLCEVGQPLGNGRVNAGETNQVVVSEEIRCGRSPANRPALKDGVDDWFARRAGGVSYFTKDYVHLFGISCPPQSISRNHAVAYFPTSPLMGCSVLMVKSIR